MQLDINRRQSKFMDFIKTSKLTLKGHECGERNPKYFISPVGSMGFSGMDNCPYSHNWQRTINSIEISWPADKLLMMREKTQLGQL